MTLGRGIVAAACLVWLAGCQTASGPDGSFPNLLNSAVSPQAAEASASAAAPPSSDAIDQPPATPQMLGADPNDDLSIGKKYFRQGSYGLAERHFRKAVELHPRDAEAWVGLAAAYDRLRRFDLADRAYDQAVGLLGPTPAILNNRGYSYMLRGDHKRARTTLMSAQARDPGNPYIANNLQMLDESARKAKAIN
jgi:Flp pilus assembly protein TadD